HTHPFFFSSKTPPPPTSTLFPYTTLFRSFIHVWCRCGLHPEHLQQFRLTGCIERPDTEMLLDPLLMLIQRWPTLIQRLQAGDGQDRKSTRLNSSHVEISYAVFCLKKKITK